MDSEPTGRAVQAATVANLRDLGGIPLPGAGQGRSVRPGALLRSADLARHDPQTDPVLTERGVQVVFDLRTTGEREAAPDVLPPGARPFVGDVLGTRPGAAPARLGRYLEDPVLAEQELGGGLAERRFEDAYRRMVLSPGACSAYAALVQTAADDGTHPLLFHCTAGKDRTGWGAALLLLLLGAGQDAVRSEYLAVNDASAPGTSRTSAGSSSGAGTRRSPRCSPRSAPPTSTPPWTRSPNAGAASSGTPARRSGSRRPWTGCAPN